MSNPTYTSISATIDTVATHDSKLSGIADGATANDTDANLKARANHTGTQLLSTISDAGTAASLNVPTSGNAASGEVVKGSDTRLSDARTPTAHTNHVSTDITDFNSASRAQVEDEIIAGNNVSIVAGGSGATRTLTINASSGGSQILLYKAKTSATSGDPGNGYMIWNNASQVASTVLFIDHLTDSGIDIDPILVSIKVDDEILVFDKDDSDNTQYWKVLATPTFFDHGAGSYLSVPVSLTSSTGTGTTGYTNNHPLAIVWRQASAGGVTYPVGATVSQPTAPSDGGTWLERNGSIYLRSAYASLATYLGLNPPAQQFDPTTIGRGGFQSVAKNVGGNWIANNAYVVGDYRKSSALVNPSVTYRCTVPGTSHATTEPAGLISNTTVGNTFTDGGVTWTVENIRYVAATNSTGTGNCIAYSDDHCVTWRFSAAPTVLTEIIFTGRGFVAVANTNAYFVSTDGFNWSRKTTAQTLLALACDNNGKIVFATTGTTWLYSTNYGSTLIASSNPAASVAGPNAVRYLGISGSEFCIMNTAGTLYTINISTEAVTTKAAATSMNQMEISPKGTAPTISRTSAADVSWIGLAYGAGKYVAVSTAASTSQAVMTSTDGKTGWALQTTPTTNPVACVAFGAGRFVALGTSYAMTSTDGITWTTITGPANANNWRNIVYDGTNFVATASGGADNSRMAYSADGLTWNISASTSSGQFYCMTFGGGKVVAAASASSTVIYSSDSGVTWSTSTAAQALAWGGMAYGLGLFVAVAGSGTNRIMTSPDAITWTTRTSPADNVFSCAAFGDGMFMAIAPNGAGLCSYNGIDWFARPSQVRDCRFLLYNSNLFVGVCIDGVGVRVITISSELTIVASASAGTTTPKYSNDIGVTWTNCAVAGASLRKYVYSISFARWYGLSNANSGTALYWSPDGVAAWTLLTLAAYGIGITGIDTGDSKFMLVCTNTSGGNNTSNLQKLATSTTFVSAASIPQGGGAFTFGEINGKLFAVSTSASIAAQLLSNDGTGWKTVACDNNLSAAERIFDLGSSVGIVIKPATNASRSSDNGVTWANSSAFPIYLSKNADGSIIYTYEASNFLRRNTDRCSSTGSNPTVGNTSATGRGFVFKGHGVHNTTVGKHFFPGISINGKASIYWINDAGTSDGIIETGLNNSQFDFIATKNDGSLILALCKIMGQIWGSTDNGTTWSYYSTISQSNSAWTDILWMEPRGCFVAAQAGGMSSGLLPLWFSTNGRQWAEGGSNAVNMSRVGYSATLDLLCMSSASASNTPIHQEFKEIDATEFCVPRPNDTDTNIKYWIKAT